MSFPKYSDWKESDVPWLGAVPAGWTVQRFNVHTATHRNSVTPGQLDGNSVLHYSIPTVQETGHGAIEDGASIDSNKLVVDSLQLLVSKLNPHKQVVVLASPDEELLTVASTEFVPLVPVTANVKYIKYVWQSPTCLHYLLARCDSATRSHQRVSPDDITKMIWAWPSQDEQAAIVTFLDAETTKIDALVAEQEKLMALLKEKRQAVISHAVTKGLDPTVPMKDSGVEWLGEVPAHWNVLKLRRVVIQFEQGWSPECEARTPEIGEWGVLKAGCVNGGEFAAAESKALPPMLTPRPALEVRSGDLLMSRASGSPKLIGSVAVVNEPPARLMLSDKIFRLGLSQDVIPQFFALSMGSIPMRQQIELAIGGAEGLANNLPQSSIKEFWIALPPEAEQQKIIERLGAKVRTFSALSDTSMHTVDILKERRSALISAAVTGKIDVRGIQEALVT